jgi:predicted ATPase
MGIKNIKISNFKSFNEIDVTLGDLNIIVGANASGKSNFIQIFKFLKDIVTDGLEDAISLQSGIEYLRNVKLGSKKDFSIEFSHDDSYYRGIKMDAQSNLILLKNILSQLKFGLSFTEGGDGFNIINQKFNQIFSLELLRTIPGQIELTTKNDGNGEFGFSFSEGKILQSHYNFKSHSKVITDDDILPKFMFERTDSTNSLILNIPYLPPFTLFNGVAIYDFDPKLSQRAVQIAGKSQLEEDGNNLAIVLKNILGEKEKERLFLNILEDILPFIRQTKVENIIDKSLSINVKEIYSEASLPASLLSDGTINLISLIVALYFEEKSIVIIEEPDRYIHPSLIPKVLEIIKDASKKKQIIITTHNPEMVRYADLENLFLVYRNKEGFSEIIKPADKPIVNKFIQNNVSKEELFVQNLLGE